MIRGTTPVIVLNLSMEMQFDTLYVTFQQKKKTVFEKTLSDVLLKNNQIVISLTQADTLSLDSKEVVFIQLRGKIGEKAYASKIVKTLVSDILKDGEI